MNGMNNLKKVIAFKIQLTIKKIIFIVCSGRNQFLVSSIIDAGIISNGKPEIHNPISVSHKPMIVADISTNIVKSSNAITRNVIAIMSIS
jgi:hypothetical protein